MLAAVAPVLPALAAGWSALYLLAGGGLGGAVIVYFIARALGH